VFQPEPPVHETNVPQLIDQMHQQYLTSKEANSGDTWYHMVYHAKMHILQTMRTAKRIDSEELDEELFDQCVLEHMIELLLYKPCLDLLNYLFVKDALTPFEQRIKAYFKVQEDRLCVWDNTRIVYLRRYENQWVETVGENKKTLRTKPFGTVVGGIANNSEDERVFKSKSMRPVSDATNITYGQICTQASKSGPRERIAEVLGLNVTEYHALEQKPLCCELELLLRYLHKLGPQIWFLSAVEVLENNEQVTRENNATVVNLMKPKRVNTKK